MCTPIVRLRFGAWVAIGAAAAVFVTGDVQEQGMPGAADEMAAAGLCTRPTPVACRSSPSAALDGSRELFALKVPYVLSSSHRRRHRSREGDRRPAWRASRGVRRGLVTRCPGDRLDFRLIRFRRARARVAEWAMVGHRGGRTQDTARPRGPGLPLLPLAATVGCIFTEIGPSVDRLRRDADPPTASPAASRSARCESFTAFTVIYARSLSSSAAAFAYARAASPTVVGAEDSVRELSGS